MPMHPRLSRRRQPDLTPFRPPTQPPEA
jgi:hypothetical protein